MTSSFRRGKQGVAYSGPLLAWDEIREDLDVEASLAALDIDIAREGRGEMWAHCPLPDHPGQDRSGSNFSINASSLVWKCFTCDEGGSFPELAIRVRDLEDGAEGTAWQQALRILAEASDIPLDGGDTDEFYEKNVARAIKAAGSWEDRRQRERKQMPVFAPGALRRFEPCPMELIERWHIWDPAVVEAYDLRFDPAHEQRGYTGPAIIIPHYFRGKLVGYQRRWMEDDRPSDIPKYTNTDDFPKAETLYGWDMALEAAQAGLRVAVVESVMTVMRLACLGEAAVSTFGASVTDEQIRLLATLRGGVALSGDNDRAGRKSLRKTADRLVGEVPVDIIPTPSKAKADLADLPDGEARALLASAYHYDGIDPIRGE